MFSFESEFRSEIMNHPFERVVNTRFTSGDRGERVNGEFST